ncbi:MAG: carbon-nitrogen family hydrolase [Clostridiales bacterium]|nr:carbon-nitrogen family hydrolase [Clostridiales bacterium]
MKVALAQISPRWMKKEETMDLCRREMKKAAEAGAKLIVFPEMTLTGFSPCWEETAELWEDSWTKEAFSAAAKQYGMTVVYGSVIKRDGRPENHGTAISPQGEVLADYVKIHPFLGWEEERFRKGEHLSYFQAGEFTCALFICYDLRFPEIFSAAAKKSDLMIVMASWPSERQNHWRVLAQARAIENQCYVAAVNRTGEGGGFSYGGDCMLIDPLGNILADGAGGLEGILYGEVDKKQVQALREAFPKENSRRPEVYQKLFR